MFITWEAVSTLDRVLDDVMGSAIGTATNSRSFRPAIDIHNDDEDVVEPKPRGVSPTSLGVR